MDTLISKLIENDLLWIYITIDMSFELLLPAGRLKPKYISNLSSLVSVSFLNENVTLLRSYKCTYHLVKANKEKPKQLLAQQIGNIKKVLGRGAEQFFYFQCFVVSPPMSCLIWPKDC